MNFEPAGPLRTSTNLAAPRAAENGNGALDPAEGFETIGDLVAELIATIDLVPRDRLAAARGRARIVGMAQALQDEGCVHPDGVARALARRYGFPFIDLAEERASPSAAELIPPEDAAARGRRAGVPQRQPAARRRRRPEEHPRHRRAAARDPVRRRVSPSRTARRSWPSSSASPARAR